MYFLLEFSKAHFELLYIKALIANEMQKKAFAVFTVVLVLVIIFLLTVNTQSFNFVFNKNNSRKH